MSERIWDGLRKNALYKSTYTFTLLYWVCYGTWNKLLQSDTACYYIWIVYSEVKYKSSSKHQITNTSRVSSLYLGQKKTSLHCHWQTRVTQCLRLTVMYTDVDGQCNKLVNNDHHQCMTLPVHLSWQHLRWSAIPEIWLVPTKIQTVHAPIRDGLPSVG